MFEILMSVHGLLSVANLVQGANVKNTDC